MKKPVNKFAIGLWILAAIYLIGQVWALFYFYHMAEQLAHLGKAPERFPAFLDTPPNAVLTAAILASLGMLIEIGDKIRWLLERRRRVRFKLYQCRISGTVSV
jgi:hypothetical protein